MDNTETQIVRARHVYPAELLSAHVNIITLTEELEAAFPGSGPLVSKKGGSGDIIVEIDESLKYDQVKPTILAHSVAADETPEALSAKEAEKQAALDAALEAIKSDSEAVDALSQLKELKAKVDELENRVSALEGGK